MEAEPGTEDVNDDFDLEATIAEFVRDEARTSLELPRSLSAEQRKVARRLADQHPQLKCHSYGIGTDRQLHLFKKEVGRAGALTSKIGVIGQDRPADGGATNQVRVKNTFIDDFVGDETDEPLICRSMPAGSAPQSLLERTLQRALKEGHLELAPVVEGSGPRNSQDPAALCVQESNLGLASPGSSTGHEGGYMGSSPGSSVPSSSLPPLPECSLPPMPDGLKVSMRNTFIHIESTPIEQRIVQSMPDGMFRQCLNAELVAKSHGSPGNGEGAEMSDEESSLRGLTGPLLSTPPMSAAPSPLAYAPPAPPLAPPPPPYTPSPSPSPSKLSEAASPFIALGTEVIIQNLVKLPAFNGLSGIVQSLDAESGRYDVQLCDPSAASGWRWVKVKSDNLIVQVPPAPRYTPTIHQREEGVRQTAMEWMSPAPTWEEEQGQAFPFRLNGLV